jgi:outer membrane immunogenic protein
MKKAAFVACATLLLTAGPIVISPARADDLDQVLKRLATLEKEHATLEQENTALRERVRRLEGKRTAESPNPQRVIMDAKIEGSQRRPQSPEAAVYKAAPVTPAAPWTWTGPYVGAHVGWGRQLTTIDDPYGSNSLGADGFAFPLAPIRDFNSQGVLGGMQAGWNYQIGHLVAGSELSFSSADVKGGRTDGPLNLVGAGPTPITIPIPARTWFNKLNWLATATTRLGYAEESWLMYTKGGLAVSRNSYTLTQLGSAASGTTGSETGTDTRPGLVVGAGVEWAFWKGWSAVAEYDYINFGSKQVLMSGTFPAGSFFTGPFFQTIPIEQSLQIVKLGLNYRLGWAPDAIVARY